MGRLSKTQQDGSWREDVTWYDEYGVFVLVEEWMNVECVRSRLARVGRD